MLVRLLDPAGTHALRDRGRRLAPEDRVAAHRVDVVGVRAVGDRAQAPVVEPHGLAELRGERVDQRLDGVEHGRNGGGAR